MNPLMLLLMMHKLKNKGNQGLLGGAAQGMMNAQGQATPKPGMAGPAQPGGASGMNMLGGAMQGMENSGSGIGAVMKLLASLIGIVLFLLLQLTPSYAQVPLIGDNGIAVNALAGCPNRSIQFPVGVWTNPTQSTIYITGFSIIIETSNDVVAADMWASVYRQSDMSRLYNGLHEFIYASSYRAEDERDFQPNYFTLAPGDALLLEGGCIAYDTHPSHDAGLVLNVIYSLQKP